MAHRRLVEAINENRILYDSNPKLVSYGRQQRWDRHNRLIRPAFSRESRRRRGTPLMQASRNRKINNTTNEHPHQQPLNVSESSERVLQSIVVTQLNSVSYKLLEHGQIHEHEFVGQSIQSDNDNISARMSLESTVSGDSSTSNCKINCLLLKTNFNYALIGDSTRDFFNFRLIGKTLLYLYICTYL